MARAPPERFATGWFDRTFSLDPQAYILSPENAVRIARAIVQSPDHYRAGQAAGLTAIDLLKQAHDAGQLKIPDRELPWLNTMRAALEELPDREETFIDRMMSEVNQSRFIAVEYDLPH